MIKISSFHDPGFKLQRTEHNNNEIMASMKWESGGHQLESHHPSDTPGSNYHTAQNTPEVLHWDNCQEQQQVAPAALKRETVVRTTELVLRMCEVVLCLVSASIMATDRTQGWAGDSFDRYKEYRYCLSVNVIGCVYSGFQACEKAYQLMSAKNKGIFTPNLRSHFDYLMDQVVAYLLVSASSSAATRVKDWESNWGKDDFTEKASASIAMAFLGFIAFAISSLISFFKLGTSTSSST
ncbi:CASP-like protein 4A3 [Prosopis cineraria]|uniref:CASP-like protein 4A3 n=1 Tax=Prosopis cineraria TaxID=364024 RepID=UPI00240EE2C6|nr:CASP-like protein 4A3 [Prosopis cineraria]